MKQDSFGPLPSLDEVKNFRSLKGERGRRIQIWVTTKLLPCTVGKNFWNEKKAHQYIISEMKEYQTTDGKTVMRYNRVPVAGEALLYLLYENNEKKWRQQLKDRRDGKKRELKYYNQFLVYSQPSNGRKRFEGWSVVGKQCCYLQTFC